MPEKQPKPFERLPGNVIPKNYALRLQPDLAKFTFQGSQEITLDVKEETQTVILNCADIKVLGAKFGDAAAELSYNEEDEKLTLAFPTKIPVGTGTLSMSFTGELNDKMKGFYRSKYTTPGGEERYGAVTQFEATDARRAFPCWDEPAVKATFDVTLVVPKDRVALSNMPVKCEAAMDGDSNLKVVQYERTPIMSTYLLAFVVGEYDFIEDKDSDGVLVRVYTPVGKGEQGRFALEVAVKTLPFYKDYFQIAYPLPKMDLIAIADFAAGAMENWGLVTYRETALLIDPDNSSSSTRQWVALVVGHEIAHQWFGNLVTMEWWTHLWLNEGFASWIEYLCVDHCFPEYDIWTQFVSSDFTKAMELDALRNSHPIEVPVGHPSEVDEIFDAISYSKGASVIRMLHDYIGDKDFRTGMHQYICKWNYKNAQTPDLWKALEGPSGKPVGDVMKTWTSQMGFPVLKVSQRQDGTNRVLTVTQEKFCADGKRPDGDFKWMVPAGICTASSPNKPVLTFMLDKETAEVTVPNVKPGDWVKLNSGTVGFFRTRYDSDMLDLLLPAVRNKTLPPRDRLGLQNDLFALARAGVAPTVDFLKLAMAYKDEDNYTVWSDLSSNLSSLSVILQYTEYYNNYQAYIRDLFKPIGAKLGWKPKPKEGHLDALLRSLVIGRLGRNGDPEYIKEAQARFEKHFDESETLPADFRGPVYTTVLTHGNEELFEKMLKLIERSDMQEEKVRIMRSLGAVKDEKLIQRVLEFAMSEQVRSQDAVFVVAGVTGSVLGREKAWKFVQQRWEEFLTRYKGGFLLSRLVKSTAESFITEERALEVEAFYEKNPAQAAERTIQQAIENIRLNAQQLKRDSEAMQAYLKEWK